MTQPLAMTTPTALPLRAASTGRKARRTRSPSSSSSSSSSSSDLGNAGMASPSDCQQYADGVPRSVRNAPSELRAVIRRRQNNESSKRCRERRMAELAYMQRKYKENHDRIRHLERTLCNLSVELFAAVASHDPDERCLDNNVPLPL